MLKIIINDEEFWDEEKLEFLEVQHTVLELEHSLLSLSKWEAKHQVPFLSAEAKSNEQVFDYVMCMMLTEDVTVEFVETHKAVIFDHVNDYINSPQSATTFGSLPDRGGPSEVITSELIYYWMVAYNIPSQYEQWHLNRLFALIRICNDKNSPPKKMSRQELAEYNARVNEERKKALGTRG